VWHRVSKINKITFQKAPLKIHRIGFSPNYCQKVNSPLNDKIMTKKQNKKKLEHKKVINPRLVFSSVALQSLLMNRKEKVRKNAG
jgi:hypothetical protein